MKWPSWAKRTGEHSLRRDRKPSMGAITITSPHVQTDHIPPRIAAENSPAGQDRRSPAGAAQYLGMGDWLESIGGCRGDYEFAVFVENDQLAVGDDQRANARFLRGPLLFAGGKLDALERGIVAFVSVETIDEFAQRHAGVEVGAEDFALPKDFGFTLGGL